MSPRFTGFSPEIKATIRSRGQNLCEVCGQHTSDLTAHHRRPRGMGGTTREDTNSVSNGLWVCALCHHRIESHRALSYENGWLVRQSADPASVPVLRRERWVLLDGSGGVEPAGEAA